MPGTPPIVSFGNFQNAGIATVGLNPSHREFSHGYVATGFGDIATVPRSVISEILTDQYSYFQRPQYRWFDRLEIILKACGASYKDGSAASLDLVQWATQPVWGRLNVRQKRRLLEADVPFLEQQLRKENIRHLLVNGRGVIEVLKDYIGLRLDLVDVIRGMPGMPNIPDTHLYAGCLFGNVDVIAWNVNLQGTPGIGDAGAQRIAEAVGRALQTTPIY